MIHCIAIPRNTRAMIFFHEYKLKQKVATNHLILFHVNLKVFLQNDSKFSFVIPISTDCT